MSTGNSLAMMPWFVRDYIAATRAMRLAERGAYSDLLFYQWEMGSLPTDAESLARLLGCSAKEFAEVWKTVGKKFERIGDGLKNRRLEEHRIKAVDIRGKKALGAHKTNAKRSAERPTEHDAKRGAERDGQRPAQRHDIVAPPSPSPNPSLQIPISDLPHSERVPSAVRAAEEAGSVCGTFKKIGGEPHAA